MKQSERINSHIEIYIEEVRRELHRLTPSDPFLEALRETLSDFAESNPDCTLEDLVEQFGPPELVAKDFLGDTAELSPSAVAAKTRRRSLVIGILVVLLAAVLFYCIAVSQQTQDKGVLDLTVEEGTDTVETVVE